MVKRGGKVVNKEKGFDKKIVIAIAVALVLGLLLMTTDVMRSIGYNKEKESRMLKEQVLEDLSSVEEKVKDVKRIVGLSSDSEV